ncbi:hypothetical protein GOBAR_AA37252 [Gossypium barbadense]|uniref:Uncharacterized protein n=1 Tax=Gossypium barbadense TaxID=3634 RepID=A0A2P5VX90_GOSBA|nr:hypothetical protein GOBAR_AA37252 [Gossypium barbadense]
MELMNSGFAVIYVRNGSMESVSRLHQQGQSILSSTNAHLAATREHGLDDDRSAALALNSVILEFANCLKAHVLNSRKRMNEIMDETPFSPPQRPVKGRLLVQVVFL